MEPDLRLLRYFVAVAEDLSFTTAAARLHMRQQPLSAAIKRFESALGVSLFVRTTRHVALTEVGQALLEPARAAIAAAEDAIAVARRAGNQCIGQVRIGVSSGARYLAAEWLMEIGRQLPQVRLDVSHGSTAPLLDELQRGDLEVVVAFAASSRPGLQDHLLTRLAAVLAVATGHRLADLAQVSLRDAAQETFALDGAGENPDYDTLVVNACLAAGFEPRTSTLTGLPDSWEAAVHTAGCVGLTAQGALHAAHRDLHLVPLTDDVSFPVRAMWTRDSASPARHAVVDVLRKASASVPTRALPTS